MVYRSIKRFSYQNLYATIKRQAIKTDERALDKRARKNNDAISTPVLLTSESSVRVARAISCYAEKSDQLSLDAEDALLTEESTSGETTSQQVPSDPMFTLFMNLNKSLGAMADSMLSMNQSLKLLRSEPSDDDPDSKTSKTCSTDVMSASDGGQGNRSLL